eukprot:11336950-Prorocentrum_lima.AAC.1
MTWLRCVPEKPLKTRTWRVFRCLFLSCSLLSNSAGTGIPAVAVSFTGSFLGKLWGTVGSWGIVSSAVSVPLS